MSSDEETTPYNPTYDGRVGFHQVLTKLLASISLSIMESNHKWSIMGLNVLLNRVAPYLDSADVKNVRDKIQHAQGIYRATEQLRFIRNPGSASERAIKIMQLDNEILEIDSELMFISRKIWLPGNSDTPQEISVDEFMKESI